MIEFDQGFFNLETPTAGTEVPSSRHLLRGWIVGKPGCLFTDIRVRYEGRLWPAVHGFIRADLAAHFGHPTPNLPAEFTVLISLAPGTASIEFEALGISGVWRPVHTVQVKVTGSAAPPFQPDPEAPVHAHEFVRLQRYLLCNIAAEPAFSLATHVDRLVGMLPSPRYLRHPALPLRGFFHEPAIIARALYGRLMVDGYLFHEHQTIRRVLATFDLQVWQPLNHDIVSPIASQLYPGLPNAARSHVTGYIVVPAQLPRPVALRIYAELEDDSLHLCCAQQTFPFTGEEEKKPYPAASPLLFWRAQRALRARMCAAGIAVEGGALFRRELWQAWREYHDLAPRGRPTTNFMAGDITMPPSTPLGPILLCTHNLSYEGAPLLFLEYARHLAQHGGASLTVVSAQEGPLRAAFRLLGATVQIVDLTPLARADSIRAWRSALATLSREIDGRAIRLVVANTLASYWAVHFAHRARRPSLLYIHESTTPTSFFRGHASKAVLPCIEETFSLATRVSFNTASTRQYYLPFARRPNYCLNHGWIDLAAINAHRSAHPRSELRARLGLAPGRLLVINPGTVCERKGQHIFASAVDLLWRQHPELAATAEFWMIGGRKSDYDTDLANLLTSIGRPNLRVLPESNRVYDYYGAADLYVCSSFEESFPRVVLEAMAMEVPILSTDVHGIPEIVRPEQEAMLIPPGNPAALATGLARMLREPDTARRFAASAHARVKENFSAALLLPRHLALTRAVAADNSCGS